MYVLSANSHLNKSQFTSENLADGKLMTIPTIAFL